MKLFQKSILLLYFLVVVGYGCETKQQSAANSNRSQQLNESEGQKVSAVLKAMQKGDLETLVNLFHFPPSYTQAQLDADKSHVKKSLEIIQSEFGKITKIEPLKAPAAYYHVSVAGADIPYWKQHSQFKTFQYTANFSKMGDGYLVVEVCRITNEYQVRFIHYAIPPYVPLAKERLGLILAKMARGA